MWSFSFAGTAAEVAAALKKWGESEFAQLAPEFKSAAATAADIADDFLHSVKQDAAVAISAADSDLEGAGFNIKLNGINHPPTVSVSAPAPGQSVSITKTA